VINPKESRSVLAKTRRLLASSKELLRALDDPLENADEVETAAFEGPSGGLSDCAQTIPIHDATDGAPAPSRPLADGGEQPETWDRPRQPR